MHQHNKVDVARRIVATAADFFIAVALFFLIALLSSRQLASMAAGFYLLFRDAPGKRLFDGTSPGKWLLSMKVVGDRGQACEAINSIKRNLTLASFFLTLAILTPCFRILPFVRAAHALFPALFVGLTLLCMETYKLLTDPKQQRIGDLLAGTSVVERHPQTYRPGL